MCLSAVLDKMAGDRVITLSIIAVIIERKGYPKRVSVCVSGLRVFVCAFSLQYVLAQTTISIAIKPITMGHWGNWALHWTIQRHHHQMHYQANYHITF